MSHYQSPRSAVLESIFRLVPFFKPKGDFWIQSDSSGSFKYDCTSDASTITGYDEQPMKQITLPFRMFQLARPVLRRLKISHFRSSKNGADQKDCADTDVAHRVRNPHPTIPTAADSTYICSNTAYNDQVLADRAMREEQDKAFEQASARDRQRIEAIREAERLAQEFGDQIQKQAQLKQERKDKEEAYKNLQTNWRRWARRALIPTAPDNHSIQVNIRLPSGARCQGRLPPSATLETLHIMAETFLIPASCSACEDPQEPPEGYTHEQEFQLVWAIPRQVVPNDKGILVSDLEILRRGAVLVMEYTESNGGEYESESENEEV